MNERKPIKLGQVQLEIMNVLWEKGGATAKELTDALSANRRIAHSTVQTLLRKLEAKGAVSHEQVDRTFVFKPVHQRAEVETATAHELLTRVFQGSAYSLVSHLLKHEKLSPDELHRLQDLIIGHASERK